MCGVRVRDRKNKSETIKIDKKQNTIDASNNTSRRNGASSRGIDEE